ncbi:hypothetical protein Lmor_2224 [Legionella moravica]|uniref:Signal peptidase I n=1 Tax=Legionella moravica TaxID=39962 RepID=A0A378JUQ1_9GAMM|nr:hypothetical protein [Legionella moravica]KTD32286.1 hypothetical protein Lmor_2224 [Legionella moravica]STX62383.1 signal peptidase I [Legionella moravica]
MNYIYSGVPTYLALFLIWIYIAYDAYRLNVDKNGVKLNWYNKWYFYIFFALIFYFIFLLSKAFMANYQHPRIINEIFSPTLQTGDLEMAKMNYGHSSGFFITNVFDNSAPFNSLSPVLIFSSPKYTVGSFIAFKSSDENKIYVGKVIGITGDTFTKKSTSITIPQDMVLVLVNKDETILIPMKDIVGKLLYIFWARNFARIGTRVD